MVDLVGLRLAAALLHATPGAACVLHLDDGSTLLVAAGSDDHQLPAADFRDLVATAARAGADLPGPCRWLAHVDDLRFVGAPAGPPGLHRFWWDGTPVWCFATTMRRATAGRALAEAMDDLHPATRGTRHVEDLQLLADDLLGVTVVCCLDDEPTGCARTTMEHLAGACLVAELIAA